jgi:hypothetical protein
MLAASADHLFLHLQESPEFFVASWDPPVEAYPIAAGTIGRYLCSTRRAKESRSRFKGSDWLRRGALGTSGPYAEARGGDRKTILHLMMIPAVSNFRRKGSLSCFFDFAGVRRILNYSRSGPLRTRELWAISSIPTGDFVITKLASPGVFPRDRLDSFSRMEY